MSTAAAQLQARKAQAAYAVPLALVRDLLAVGLLVEHRPSARDRLDRALGRKTTETLLRAIASV